MRGLLSVATAVVALISSAWAQTPPPVEAFGRLPQVADAAISPDGNKVALAMNMAGAPTVSVVDLERRQTLYSGLVPSDTELRGVGWVDDGRVTFIISQALPPGRVLPGYMRYRGAPRRVEFLRNGVVDLATRDTRLLSTSENAWEDPGSQLIAPIEGDPGFGRLIGNVVARNASHPTIFRVSLDTGHVRRVITPGESTDTIGYLLDERGAVIVRSDSDERSNAWRVFVYDGATPRLLAEGVSDTGHPLAVRGLLADGRLVVIDDDEAGEFYAVYAIDRDTGAREQLLNRPGMDVNMTLLDPWTRRVVGAAWVEQETKQNFFVADLQAAYERITALYSGAARIISWSRDHRRILFYGELELDGGGYYIFTPADDRVDRISFAYPELAAAQSGQRQALTYRARDGTRIPAYLTLPRGEGRNLPLVLLVHGGPAARDTMDFDWWASFLASRGYAVLQPNFRGSEGYGATWERAGLGQWGGLMQTDVEDGIGPLARAGIIDPARVCIVGASYGGYAALAGATLTPERYRCAASIAGVTDLVEFVRAREAQSGAESMASDYWRQSIGDRQEDRDRLRGLSPANLADRVHVPILLLHGTDDSVVPIDQSRRMLRALEAAGKPVRFVELRGDDHYLSNAQTRTQMLRELEAFLAANSGPR